MSTRLKLQKFCKLITSCVFCLLASETGNTSLYKTSVMKSLCILLQITRRIWHRGDVGVGINKMKRLYLLLNSVLTNTFLGKIKMWKPRTQDLSPSWSSSSYTYMHTVHIHVWTHHLSVQHFLKKSSWFESKVEIFLFLLVLSFFYRNLLSFKYASFTNYQNENQTKQR